MLGGSRLPYGDINESWPGPLRMITRETSTETRTQLSFIEPMQVSQVRELPDGGFWTYDAKLDGYRCLAVKRGSGVVLGHGAGLISRNDFRLSPAPVTSCPKDTIIDAEVVVVDENGRCTFNALQHKHPQGHLQLYAFDALIHTGKTSCAYRSRNAAGCSPALSQSAVSGYSVHPVRGKARRVAPAAKELELEGLIAKRKGSLYEPGKRSGARLKYKINRSQEFVIGGYTAGNPFDAVIVGCYDSVELNFVAKVRACFVPHLRSAIYPLLRQLHTDKCPFTNLPERRTLYSLTGEEMKHCQ